MILESTRKIIIQGLPCNVALVREGNQYAASVYVGIFRMFVVLGSRAMVLRCLKLALSDMYMIEKT